MGSFFESYPGIGVQTRTRPTPAATSAAGAGTRPDVPGEGYIMSSIIVSSMFILLISSSEIPMP